MFNRYENIQVLGNMRVKGSFYKTVLYPEIPLSENDIYVITGGGDRYDLLADQYYGDTGLWWIISIANASSVALDLPSSVTQNTMFPPIGSQIRIPYNSSEVISSFKKLNGI